MNYYPTKKTALAAAKDWRKRGYNAKVLPPVGTGRMARYGVSVRAKKGKKVPIGYGHGGL